MRSYLRKSLYVNLASWFRDIRVEGGTVRNVSRLRRLSRTNRVSVIHDVWLPSGQRATGGTMPNKCLTSGTNCFYRSVCHSLVIHPHDTVTGSVVGTMGTQERGGTESGQERQSVFATKHNWAPATTRIRSGYCPSPLDTKGFEGPRKPLWLGGRHGRGKQAKLDTKETNHTSTARMATPDNAQFIMESQASQSTTQ